MSAWMVIVAAGIASYLPRVEHGSARLTRSACPPAWRTSAGLVAHAAFAALVVTSLAGTVVGTTPVQATPSVVAVVVAVVAVVDQLPYAAVLAGLLAFWILTAITIHFEDSQVNALAISHEQHDVADRRRPCGRSGH